MSTPSLGSNWCCTPAEISQLSGRMFHPFELSGSNCVLGRIPPKLRSEIVPQKSPPVARRSWAW